ncbi:hypothetical protein CL622_00040 [archaeon]|nr:hypothetical protein [archaeon]
MRIAGLDPGKKRDSFSFVGIEIKNDNIYVLGVKNWLHRNYIDVEQDIANIDIDKHFDHYVLEINNTGEHVWESLAYQHRLQNVIPVFTSRELKDQKKIAAGKVMSKNEMVVWMARMFQSNRIKFPTKTTEGIEELKRQLTIFTEHISEAGQHSFYAEGNEHDDTVMALMLACFIGRHYIKRQEVPQQKMTSATKRFGYETKLDELGTGVPDYMESISAEVYYP